MGLIRNQVMLLRYGLGGVKRYLASCFHTAATDLHQMRVSRHIRQNLVHDVLEKPQIAQELENSTFPAQPVRISFLASTRRVDNPNHRLQHFLASVTAQAKDPARVEVLLAVDSDDDIEHYLLLKRKFANRLRFRVFVSPVRYGYRGLHLYDRLLIPHMAPGSRMMCDYSDDCTIILKHFDEELLSIDALYPDNLYFVHTNPFRRVRNDEPPLSEIDTRAEYLEDVSHELLRLYWILQAHRPASYFPVLSKGVIDCATEALAALPPDKRAQWSPFANAFICDCYIDILSTLVKAQGLDRIHSLSMTEIKRFNILTGYQHKTDEYGLSASNQAFVVMLAQETQNHLKRIAGIVKHRAQTFKAEGNQ